MGIQTGGKGTK